VISATIFSTKRSLNDDSRPAHEGLFAAYAWHHLACRRHTHIRIQSHRHGLRHLLSEAGCEPHQIAPRCPWENGYAERFIRSLKESLLRKCDFDSQSALRLALFEFQTYWNNERPHQGIDNRTVLGSSDVPTATGKVVRIPRVGGLINHYERVA
jgi:transposase InsO family protein